MNKSRRPSQPTDYKIGYRRPPEHTRFQPGRSGNPKGRPRQQRTTGALLQQGLSKKVKIQENGVTKYLPAELVALIQVANKAVKGDLRATKLLFDLKDRYQGSSGPTPFIIRVEPEDLKL